MQLEHAMKVMERLLKGASEKNCENWHCSMQFGIMAGRGTTYDIFIFRQLLEVYLARNEDLWMDFVIWESIWLVLLLGVCCAGKPDGTVPPCWLSRRSTMSPVGFSWWPHFPKFRLQTFGHRAFAVPGPQLSSAQDYTISWQSVVFKTETESAFISSFLNASVDPYLMKGLISFLYYYIFYLIGYLVGWFSGRRDILVKMNG